MAANDKKPQQMKSSLTKKTIIVFMCIAIVIGTFAIAIYNKGSYDMIISQYEHYSIDIARLVAAEIYSEQLENLRDAVKEIYDRAENKVMSDHWGTPEFEAYVSQFESVKETDDYKKVLADLRKMQDQIDVNCLYITWLDQENACNVYLVDAAHEDPCPPGCIDPLFSDKTEEILENLSTKGVMPTICKTEEYGWLIATGMPVFNDQGEIVAIAAVDISMNVAMSELIRFMIRIGLAFLGIALLFCILSIILINKLIVKPINTLSRAASQYKDNKNAFSELNIKRNDEIGVLADSMVQMEKDIDRYVNDLSSTREYADEMNLAANTDALTKALNKRAYDIKAKQLNETRPPYGIILIDINDLKGINDTYGHENGDVSIKTVCRIICRVFDCSAVYRIGGDEFIVVLEKEDYANREALIRELSEAFRANEANESAAPWERVSAAVGSAVFDPDSDKSVRNVVQRADVAMYHNKKAAKES